ncbi:hypothetical protein [Anatilimnocola floriformis]|uniref:hypothetical protein n=1 Tax=Anatilimnocola floriformis TaxID=2948575 RepID=UPI0020C287B9|nr:hypothetical protein [Anatilimnocola floriformis]
MKFTPIAGQFFVFTLEFSRQNDAKLPTFRPHHALSMPSLSLCADSVEVTRNPEQHYNGGSWAFLSRESCLAECWQSNQGKLPGKDALSGDFDWFVGVEFGVPPGAWFLNTPMKDRKVTLFEVALRIIEPTAAEIAQFTKGGAA